MANDQFVNKSQVIKNPGQEEKALTGRATTRLMPAESTMKRIMEMELMIDRTMPEPLIRRACHLEYKPAWDPLERRWKYLKMSVTTLEPGSTNGLCRACQRIMHGVIVYFGQISLCAFRHRKTAASNNAVCRDVKLDAEIIHGKAKRVGSIARTEGAFV